GEQHTLLMQIPGVDWLVAAVLIAKDPRRCLPYGRHGDAIPRAGRRLSRPHRADPDCCQPQAPPRTPRLPCQPRTQRRSRMTTPSASLFSWQSIFVADSGWLTNAVV